MEGKRHFYLGLLFWRYLLWLVLSQQVGVTSSVHRIVFISFFVSRCHDSLRSQGYSRNRRRRNASLWRQSFLFSFSSSCLIVSTVQLGILAHAFPPSRARSLAFATFSSGAALGAVTGNTLGGVVTEFTKYEFVLISSLALITLILIQKNMAFLVLSIIWIRLQYLCQWVVFN